MPKRILELFAGSGSVGKIFEAANWEVTSVDLSDKLCKPTICCSVLDIPLDKWPAGHFDVVWGSPPCVEYSRAKTTGVRDLEGADRLVLHTLALIRALNPTFWFMENPQTGLLKTRSFIQGLPYKDLSYCHYAPEWGYKKDTRVWTNCEHWSPRLCRYDCKALVVGARRHIAQAQRGPTIENTRWNGNKWKQSELYRIPPKLCEEILAVVTFTAPDTE